MPMFRGMPQRRRGGAGAGRGDNPHNTDFSQMDQAISNWNPSAEMAAMPSKPAAPANASPASGRGRYLLQGGGYIRTTPTEGSTTRHDVTVYNDSHVPQYSVKDAEFGHNAETGEAKFYGGTDTSSNRVMGHTWTGKTMGGNVHQDDSPY